MAGDYGQGAGYVNFQAPFDNPDRQGPQMALQRSDVEKIAHLARLEISEADTSSYAENLSNILALVEQMNAINTDGVQPLAHPLETTQRLRDDEVGEENQRDRFQSIAPQVEDGLYLVPKVIE